MVWEGWKSAFVCLCMGSGVRLGGKEAQHSVVWYSTPCNVSAAMWWWRLVESLSVCLFAYLFVCTWNGRECSNAAQDIASHRGSALGF